LRRALSRHDCRRIARSGLRERRASRAASAGEISPRQAAATTSFSASTTSSGGRMRPKSMPSLSPGSGSPSAGRISFATGRSR